MVAEPVEATLFLCYLLPVICYLFSRPFNKARAVGMNQRVMFGQNSHGMSLEAGIFTFHPHMVQVQIVFAAGPLHLGSAGIGYFLVLV